MKYTQDEAVSEILKRSGRISRRRVRRARAALSCASVVIFALLVFTITGISGQPCRAPRDTYYGSFLLSAEVGGYVLAAVIAFALGVTIAVFCMRYRKKDKDREDRL